MPRLRSADSESSDWWPKQLLLLDLSALAVEVRL